MEKKSIPVVKSKKLFIGGAILLSVITLAESLTFLEAKCKIFGALNKLDDSNKIKDFLKSDWMYLIIVASLIATMALISAAVLRHKQNILTIQLNRLTQEKNTLTQEKDTLQNQLTTATQEKEKLRTDLNTLTHEKNTLTHEKNTLTHEKNTLNQEKTNLQTNLNTLNQEKTDLQTKSNADIETLKKEINEKHTLIDELNQQLEEKKQEISKGIDQSCQKIEELDKKIESLETQLNQSQNLYNNLSTNSTLLLNKYLELEQPILEKSLNELIILKTSLESEIKNYGKEEEIFEKTSGEKSKRHKALEKQPEEKRKLSDSNKSSDEKSKGLLRKLSDTFNNTNKRKESSLTAESLTSSLPATLRSGSDASDSKLPNEEIDFIKTANEHLEKVKKTQSEYDEANKIEDTFNKLKEFEKIDHSIAEDTKLITNLTNSITALQAESQNLRSKNKEILKTKQDEFLNKTTDDLYYLENEKLFSINKKEKNDSASLENDNILLQTREYFKCKQSNFDSALYSKTTNSNIDKKSFQMNSLDILETIDITINNKDYKLIFNNQKMFLLNDENDQHFEVSSLSRDDNKLITIDGKDIVKENFITELLKNKNNIGKVFAINCKDQSDTEKTKKFTLTNDMLTKVQPPMDVFILVTYLKQNPIDVTTN